MEKPTFAIVGHVNKGKSSVVATLSEDDSVVIAHEARTTRESREFQFRIDERVLFSLIDTPGFEQARRALAWMRERASSAAERPEVITAFVREHQNTKEFPEECELLRPVLEGAGILYVVDGSRPFSPEYEAEMEILRWTGSPRMALINQIGEREHVEEWRAALDQYFSIVRTFNAHAADFALRLQLLCAFRELREDWRPQLDEAIQVMESERVLRRRRSARIIAGLLADALTLTIEKKVSEETPTEEEKPDLERRYREALRRRERLQRDEVEDLYQHRKLQRRESELSILAADLFSETTWLRLGLTRKQLAMTGAVGGAMVGGALDAALGGADFFLGSVAGAALGGVSGWISRRQLTRVSIQGLRLGGRLLRIGPMKNPRFPWILLDRALIHHRAICNRAHARRDEAVIDSSASETAVVTHLSASTRRRLDRLFSKIIKARGREAREEIEAELASELEDVLKRQSGDPV